MGGNIFFSFGSSISGLVEPRNLQKLVHHEQIYFIIMKTIVFKRDRMPSVSIPSNPLTYSLFLGICCKSAFIIECTIVCVTGFTGKPSTIGSTTMSYFTVLKVTYYVTVRVKVAIKLV